MHSVKSINYLADKEKNMLNNFKETILKALAEKGWSCEELDYRIKERAGFTAEFIAGSSGVLNEDTKKRIASLLEISASGQNDYESFIESLMSELYNYTRYGNLHWNKVTGRAAVENADAVREIKRLTIKEDAKGLHEGIGTSTLEVEGGPCYTLRTRNGLDVFISVSECIPFVEIESRNLLLNVYVTDKRGYLLTYCEGDMTKTCSRTEERISLVFLMSLLHTMYRSIMEYYGDELYEYPF